MFDEEQFKNFTLVKLGAKFRYNEMDLIDFLRQNDLLTRFCLCSRCGSDMATKQYSRSIDNQLVWRCQTPNCRKTNSLRVKSFFEQCLLKLWQAFGLTLEWSKSAGSSRGSSYENIMMELEIGSPNTIVDWMQFCRDICVQHFVVNSVKIGGPGKIVEIDESLFARRKYNVGHIVEQQWIFGGYDRESKTGFLIPVQNRSSETLLPLIQQYILPGSIIYSDQWPAYNGIVHIPGMNYQHFTVCHDRNFVDPVTGVHTNGVEGMWSRAKSKFKAMHGTSRGLLVDYLAEFMFKQRYPKHTFMHFWKFVTQLYPLNPQPQDDEEVIEISE